MSSRRRHERFDIQPAVDILRKDQVTRAD